MEEVNEKKVKDDKGKEKEEAKNTPKAKGALSHILPDGRLVEMVWIPEEEISGYFVGDSNKTEFFSEVYLDSKGNQVIDPQLAKKVLLPLPSDKGLVGSDMLKFASGVEEYGSPRKLFDDVKSLIKKYMILDEQFYDIAALYAMMTWVYDRFHALPYLRVIGNYGTGKSRFVEVVGTISHRSLMAGSSITAAALYRTVDLIRGTLAYDEADMRFSDMSADIVKVLNGGHRKGSPVIRMDGEGVNMRPRAFNVFGPKILGSREPFSDLALESRCLTQRLFPMKRVDVPVHVPGVFHEEAATLRNKLLKFRFDHFDNISDDETSLGELEFPRLRQTVLAITSLAKYIDKTMLPSLLEFLVKYEEELRKAETTDVTADVVLCIVRLIEFRDSTNVHGRLYMRDVAEAFNSRFYDDYKERETRTLETREGPLVVKGQEVSARRIGTLVDKLGITKDRDQDGIYIDSHLNKKKIQSISERFGIDKLIEAEKESKKQKELNRKPVLHTVTN
jgi:hypothetical protein